MRQIAKDGFIWSDAKRIEFGIDCKYIGISHIKERRLKELTVNCHPGTMVGEYVPFYFWPRSVMLYILHRSNHPDIKYKEGQRPIVHLQADMRAVIKWANDNDRMWAFSDCNAGARHANFWSNLKYLHKLNWLAIKANNFRDSQVREGKQAEFLLYGSFPWELVEQIGVFDPEIQTRVNNSLHQIEYQPSIFIKRSWYY